MKFVIVYNDKRINKADLTLEVDARDWNEAVENFYIWVLQSEGWSSFPADLENLEYFAEGEVGVKLTAVRINKHE
jgi:hypothetical protein